MGYVDSFWLIDFLRIVSMFRMFFLRRGMPLSGDADGPIRGDSQDPVSGSLPPSSQGERYLFFSIDDLEEVSPFPVTGM